MSWYRIVDVAISVKDAWYDKPQAILYASVLGIQEQLALRPIALFTRNRTLSAKAPEVLGCLG